MKKIENFKIGHMFYSLKTKNNRYHKIELISDNNITYKYINNSDKSIENIIEAKKNKNQSILALYNTNKLYMFNNKGLKKEMIDFMNKMENSNEYKAYAIPKNFIDKIRLAYFFEVTMKKDKGIKRTRK